MQEQCMQVEARSFLYNSNGMWYQEVETKGDKQYYVEGYVATEDPDLVNDIMTKSCLIDMDSQMEEKSIKFDFEHETVEDGKIGVKMNKNPIARVVEHRVDSKGVWVKALVNKFHDGFKELWGSIKSGMIDAFSVAFLPVRKAFKYVKGKSMRLLEKVKLINIAFTGNPVNPEAKMHNVIGKSLDYLEAQDNASQSSPTGEDNKQMVEEETQVPAQEPETKEIVTEEAVKEAVKEIPEETPETPTEEKTEEVTEEVEEKSVTTEDLETVKAEIKSLYSMVEGLKSENANLKKTLAEPEFKAKLESQPEVTKLKPAKSVLDIL